MLSQTKPYHTKPYQSNPTVYLPQNSQNKSDLDENFTEVSDWCFLKPYTTKPYQTNSKSSLKPPNQVISWWNFHRSFRTIILGVTKASIVPTNLMRNYVHVSTPSGHVITLVSPCPMSATQDTTAEIFRMRLVANVVKICSHVKTVLASPWNIDVMALHNVMIVRMNFLVFKVGVQEVNGDVTWVCVFRTFIDAMGFHNVLT